MAVSERGPDYPTFHYSGTKELDLPDEGEMTIKFRVKKEASETSKDGKRFYECDIEVQSICDVEDDGDEDDGAEGEDAPEKTADILDKIMSTMEKMVQKDEEVHSMIEKD